MDDSRKTIGVIEQMRPEVTSLQKVVKNGHKSDTNFRKTKLKKGQNIHKKCHRNVLWT